MIAELKPYPKLKGSGVEWLGRLPAHWQVRRMRTVARILNGATPSSNTSTYWDGDILWITPEDLGALNTRYIENTARRITDEGYYACGTTLAPAGSLVISTRAPIGHIGILSFPACSNQGCRLIVPYKSLKSAYLYHILEAGQSELKSYGQGTTFAELSRAKLAEFVLAVPPLPEQNTIVRFLAHVDRRIRRYVRAKHKLIALLEEQKQAIIHQAVTGQINIRTGKPYPAYKPSDVNWLGDVPAHWERQRLKTLLRSVDRRTNTGKETLLSLRRDHGVVVYAEHFARPPQGRTLVGFKLVAEGQLVVNRMQANNGLVFCSGISGLVSPDYSVFEMRKPLQMQYLSDLLRISGYRAHFRRESTGLGTGTAGFLRLYDEKLLETIVFLPPVEEQTLILKSLAEGMAKIKRLIEREQRELHLIGEYRTRLIADIVTGKLDVREASAALPEIDPLVADDELDEPIDTDAEADSDGLEVTLEETEA